MGKTVNAVVAPVSKAVAKVVKGGENIIEGNVAKGLGEVGAGAVDYAKSLYGVSADNKYIGIDAAKGAYGEFKENPVGSVMSVFQAYATGGASLVPSLVEAGQSQLTQALGKSPSELQGGGGGGAPMMGDSMPQAPMIPQNNDFTIPLVLGLGAVLVFLMIRR